MSVLMAALMAGQAAAADVAAVERYLSAYEAQDSKAMAQTLSADFVYYDYPRQVRYETSKAFISALEGYLASQVERGVSVTVVHACSAFDARGRTGGPSLLLCDHRSVYAGGDAAREEHFAAIYGVKNGKIALIERLGDLSPRPGAVASEE